MVRFWILVWAENYSAHFCKIMYSVYSDFYNDLFSTYLLTYIYIYMSKKLTDFIYIPTLFIIKSLKYAGHIIHNILKKIKIMGIYSNTGIH